jgi:Protein of unknown function (DUF2857).
MGMNSSKETHLLESVLLYVQRCIVERDYHALSMIGLGGAEVEALSQLSLSDLGRLARSRTPPVRIAVDRDCLEVLLGQIHHSGERQICSLELVRRGAPAQMMAAICGMSSREYQEARRYVIGRRQPGRPSTLNEGQESRLWELWVLMGDPTRPQALAQDAYWLLVAQVTGLSLVAAWTRIQTWSHGDKTLDSWKAQHAAITATERRRRIELLQKQLEQTAETSLEVVT